MQMQAIAKTVQLRRRLRSMIYINFFIHFLDLQIQLMLLRTKYRISMALITEKPVNRPIVPPTAEIQSAIFILVSFLILSKVGVSKKILTNFSFVLKAL